MAFIEFFVLLTLITFGGWLLSEGAETASEKYGVNFAGSILLALVTTLPEYLFVFFAILKNKPDVALGSAIGACTLLVTLGYGSVILIATSRLSKNPVEDIKLSRNTRIDAIYLIATAILAFVLAWEGKSLDIKDAVILIIVFIFYVAEHYRVAHKTANTIEHNVTPERLKKAALMFVIGGAIIIGSAEPFVDSMIGIAHILGISPMAIAIILSPIASEMPEKITAYITVIRDGRLAEISIANFMGSKVNHNSLLLAIMPIVSVAGGHGIIKNVISVPFIVMTVLTVFAGINLMRRRLTRGGGWVFLLLYGLIIIAAFMTDTRVPGH